MNITTIPSIGNSCRTCMGEEERKSRKMETKRKTVSIFYEAGFMKTNLTIMELLTLTTPQLNIEKDDMLPKILCGNCVDRLIQAHEFQQMCIRVEQRFKEIINEQKPILQNNTDPLNESVMTHTINDLSNVLKVEMDEPLIDHDNICDDDDIFNGLHYDPPSSDDDGDKDSQLESQFNILKSNKRNILTKKLNEGFSQNSRLEESFEADHLDDKAKEIDNNSTIRNNVKNYEFGCDECGNRLKTRKSLKRHKLIHLRPQVKNESGDLEDEPAETVNQTNLNSNTLSYQNDGEKSTYQFECDECGSRLKTRKSLKRHKKIHLRPPGVQKEKQTKTSTPQIFECEHCKKVFQKSSALKDHIRLHTGEQPYLCSDCGKSFRKSSNLKQHLLRHGTERPYVCPDCPKDFPTLSDLASHKAVHTKTKSHVCDVCGAGFVKPYLLKAHKMYHTGEKNHKCEYCDRRFVTGDQCRRHMRTHTGEKPYKCKYCERAFAQSNDLMKHMRSHLGDNVYKCSLCPQGFRLHGDLREHFNTHKNDDEETKLRNLQALKEEELRMQIKFGLIEGT